jgi:hypothetical protein
MHGGEDPGPVLADMAADFEAFCYLLRIRFGVALAIWRDRSIVFRPERIVAIEPAGILPTSS